MYTCCPECETTFRLSADDLRKARGQVRCGECDHVFNALEFLSEENTEVELVEAEAAVGSTAEDDAVFALDTEPANDELAGSPVDEGDEEYAFDEESELDDTGAGLLVVDENDDEESSLKAWNEPADGEYEEEEAAAEHEADEYQDELSPEEAEAEEPVLSETEGEEETGDGNDEGEGSEYAEADDETDVDAVETDEEDTEEDTTIGDFDDDEPERETSAEAEAYESGEEELSPDEAEAEELALTDPDEEEEDEDSSESGEDDDEDFDDTIWERIPGVGSATYYAGEDEDPADDEDEALAAESDEVDAGDEQSSGLPNAAEMEFNVPEESWSNFFGPAPKSAPPDWEELAGTRAEDRGGDAEQDEREEESPGEQGWEEITTGNWSSEVPTPGGVTAGEVFSGEDTEEIVLETAELNKVLEEYDTAPPWQPQAAEAEPEKSKPGRTLLWFTVGVVLFVGFGTQLVHYNRDKLAAHPSLGATVRSVYQSLDSDLYPTWSVSNYEIRGSEAVAGESGTDILDIRTQIAAVGEHVTGLPQLRVVLRDRWSNPVAARHFSPEEYLGEGELPADGLLRPNQTISAHVSIMDPGADAQGFELELCLPRRHTGLDCTGRPFQ